MRWSRHILFFLIGSLFVMGDAGTAFAATGANQSGVSVQATSYAPDSEDCAFLSTINSYRKGKGLSQLVISPTLGAAADHHAQDMAAKAYFDHTLADGTTWSQNIADYGYPSSSARAEN